MNGYLSDFRRLRLSAVLLFACSLAAAQPAPGPLGSFPTVTMKRDKIALREAADEVRRQTGVTINVDLEGERTLPTLRLDKATFWQALDEIAAVGKVRVLLPTKPGPIALVQAAATDRITPTSYHGAFRVRLVQVHGKRDLTTDTGKTTYTLEVAWLPEVGALFLDGHVRNIKALDGDGKPLEAVEEGGTLSRIDGLAFTTIEVSVVDVPRKQQELSLLEGQLLVVAPSKMLTFRFDGDLKALNDAKADGAVRRLVQDEVTCRVDRIVAEKNRWSVQMALSYVNAGRPLESWQASSFVANNELVLLHKDGKRTMTPSGFGIDKLGETHATVSYHFLDAIGRRLGRLEDWKPAYRAPARIVDVPVAFRFLKAPLP